MSDLDRIADELRAVHDQDDDLWGLFAVLVRSFGDTIQLNHHPTPFPMDGLLDAETLTGLMNPGGAEMMKNVMPDYREFVLSFSAVGSAVTLFVIMLGTLPDGTRLRVPAAFVFTFDRGRLHRIDIHSDPADYEPFTSYMSAAGTAGLPGN